MSFCRSCMTAMALTTSGLVASAECATVPPTVTRSQMQPIARMGGVHVAGDQEIEPLAGPAPMPHGIRPVRLDQREVGVHAGFAHARDEIMRDVDLAAGRAGDVHESHQEVADLVGGDA